MPVYAVPVPRPAALESLLSEDDWWRLQREAAATLTDNPEASESRQFSSGDDGKVAGARAGVVRAAAGLAGEHLAAGITTALAAAVARCAPLPSIVGSGAGGVAGGVGAVGACGGPGGDPLAEGLFGAGPERGGRGFGGPFWTDFSVVEKIRPPPYKGLVSILGLGGSDAGAAISGCSDAGAATSVARDASGKGDGGTAMGTPGDAPGGASSTDGGPAWGRDLLGSLVQVVGHTAAPCDVLPPGAAPVRATKKASPLAALISPLSPGGGGSGGSAWDDGDDEGALPCLPIRPAPAAVAADGAMLWGNRAFLEVVPAAANAALVGGATQAPSSSKAPSQQETPWRFVAHTLRPGAQGSEGAWEARDLTAGPSCGRLV